MKRQRTLSDHHQRKYEQEQIFSPTLMSQLNCNFNKRFTYRIEEKQQWSFKPEDLFSYKSWQDEDLLSIKSRLNAVKSELSDKDIRTWHHHTSTMNPAGLIVNRVRGIAKPELCTQAWCKFHEILSTFPLADDFTAEEGQLKTLHLCEAPGAFIASLNHFLKSRGMQLHWDWTANTLNPHYEGNDTDHMISDDKFILQTWDHWNFGPDNTGNVMNTENIRSLQEKHKDSKCHLYWKGDIDFYHYVAARRFQGDMYSEDVQASHQRHLMTADGSIDCANNPAEQECMTSTLHYCELVSALSVLRVKGHLVLKMFTLLENTAICMIYLVCCLFDQVTVSKPATSKPGNSEVYVVCQGFRGVTDDILEKLLSNSESLTESIFPETVIPESFRKQHLACCQMFADLQINTIRKNQDSFNKTETMEVDHGTLEMDENQVELEKECCAQMYIEKCAIQSIPWKKKIVVHKKKHNQTNPSFMGRLQKARKKEGSFTQRQEVQHLPWQQRLSLQSLFEAEVISQPVILKNSLCAEDLTKWTVVSGRRLDSVRSSKFCDEQLLSLYTTYLQYHQQKMQPSYAVDDKTVDDLSIYIRGQLKNTQLDIVTEYCQFGAVLKQSLETKNIKVTLNTVDEDTCQRLYVVRLSEDIGESQALVDQALFGNCLKAVLQDLQTGDHLMLQSALPLTRLYSGLIYVLHLLFEVVQVLFPSQHIGIPNVHLFCTNFIPHKTETKAFPSTSNVENDSQKGASNNRQHNCVDNVTESEHHEKCPQDFISYVDKNSPSQGQRQVKSPRIDSQKPDETSFLIGYLDEVYRQWMMSQQKSETGFSLLEFVPMSCLYESEFYENLCWMNDNLLMHRLNSLIRQHKADQV